ncbi:hypothetical protein T459_21822 [Capsicum annuum]|uniref:ARID domain-containing protein n=1 Tax=Capsicum annuum TaxID=4072 RepID=A0A1U8DSU1_CAPAN|nr:AT-rich interactive domain-containing protein 2 [Capsicum annuum]XP_047250427.1 AT-rich interactive domain-containing protein 2 [Capsicum annuum]KAF3629656.1 putative pentatricopeptide repeat-containing protein, mitochondrial-like [Capsicum annuum]PHT74545.1 hypothetical protein T459_21822 [Capsicum annuum]
MAGWSKRVDNVAEFMNLLLKEVDGCLSFRPFPPMLGDGKIVNLCRLYLVVREKGGYQSVCSSGCWGVVAKECGFDSSSGLSLKLVYVKYLEVLSRAMLKFEQSRSRLSDVRMEFELDLEEVLMKISDEGRGKVEFDHLVDGKLSNGIEVQGFVENRSLDENVCDVKGIDEKVGVVYAEEDSKKGNKRDKNYIRLMKLSGDGKDCFIRKRKDSDEKTSVGCDQEHLKIDDKNGEFEGGTDEVGLRKFNGDEEDCIIRKRKDRNGKLRAGCDEEHLKIDDGNGDVQGGKDDVGLAKFSLVEEDGITRKRKREFYLDMLKWVTELAKDPCDPAIGHLPERSKWKSYGNEVVWKKVLLLRDEMLSAHNVDTSTQFSVWQLKQKMHPSMYDDNSGSERPRCSQRVLSAKDSLKNSGSHIDGTLIDGLSDSSAESGVWWNRRRKKITSIGTEFQADIPEWKNDMRESDSKWLGTRIWPLDKNEKSRILIERDPVGKGRQDTCGCEYPGSYDCINFHLAEKRRKLRLELGSAFYHWKLNHMGEKVAFSWTTIDEQKFHDIVKSSHSSEDESFSYWPELFKCFPHKSRGSLVCYYFNVFLLRRIDQQNRMNASDVDSDDDESGCGPRSICFGRDPKFSTLCFPKKARLGPM